MNLYVTLGSWKARFAPGVAATDAQWMAVIEEASRALDAQLGRHFYAVVATRYVDVSFVPGGDARIVELPDDLLKVQTLRVDQDGDGSYEVTLEEGVGFVLPDSGDGPHTSVQLLPGGKLTLWPIGRRRVEIAGIWGYSMETEPAGMLLGDISAEATTVSLSPGHIAEVGDTWLIDEEQLFVRSLSADVATVVRGINGTQPAAHAQGTIVRRRRYPRDIELATRIMATRFWRAGQTGHAGGGMVELGGVAGSPEYPMLRDLVARYAVRGGVGVG